MVIMTPDPTQMVQGKYTASCVVTGHLVTALSSRITFWLCKHAQLRTRCCTYIWHQKAHEAKEALSGDAEGLSLTEGLHLWCRKKTWMWISIALAKVNRTEIGSQEWMGVVFLQYCIEPSDLTRHIQILHCTCTWMQKRRPCHISSKQHMWRGWQPSQKVPNTHTCAQLPTNSPRLLRAKLNALEFGYNLPNKPPGMSVYSEQKWGLLIWDLWAWGTD